MYRVPKFVSSPTQQLPTHISLEPFFPRQVASEPVALPVAPAKAVPKHPLKPGRHISKENLVLRQFQRTEETRAAAQAPKLENIRYRVLRAFKKTINRILTGKSVGWKGLLDFQSRTQVGEQELEAFKSYLMAHSSQLNGFTSLSSEPKADQYKGQLNCEFRTYNSAYLSSIFSTFENRIAYQLYLKLVFCEDRPESLVFRFKMRCCRNAAHNDKCREKWAAFRQLLEKYLGASVAGVEEATERQEVLAKASGQ
jgi:hypothetical protein